MNSNMLLNLLMQQAPQLLKALKSSSTNSYPNIENAIVDASTYGDLESQYLNAYNHISSDLVPDSTTINVSLDNTDRALGIMNKDLNLYKIPNRAYTNLDISNQDMDDVMQSKVKLSALYNLLGK